MVYFASEENIHMVWALNTIYWPMGRKLESLSVPFTKKLGGLIEHNFFCPRSRESEQTDLQKFKFSGRYRGRGGGLKDAQIV